MSHFEWFRSWHDAPTDKKYMVIAAKAGVKVGVVSALMWALLDYASQHPNRGSIEGFDTETYAAFTGFPETEIIAIMQAMTDKKIIVDGRLANWEKRQPKREDDSTERVREYRKRKREVTQSNDSNASETNASLSLSLISLNVELENFDDAQEYCEKLTGKPAQTQGDMSAIDDLLDAHVWKADIKAGFDWLTGQGKDLRYYSSLVGPSKTAMSKRLGNKNGNTNGHKRTLTGANGEKLEVDA